MCDPIRPVGETKTSSGEQEQVSEGSLGMVRGRERVVLADTDKRQGIRSGSGSNDLTDAHDEGQ